MGSNKTTLGNAAGIPLHTFTAAGQDTGPMLYYVSPAGVRPDNYSLIRACNEFTVVLGGSGTGLQVTMYFTTDLATANGTSSNPVWFLCPSPSTEAGASWSNPMQNVVGLNVLNFKAHAIALRAVSAVSGDGTPITGNTNLTLLAGF